MSDSMPNSDDPMLLDMANLLCDRESQKIKTGPLAYSADRFQHTSKLVMTASVE